MPRTLVVVLDTNVLVSALRSSAGASFRIVQLLRDRRFRVAVTAPLLLECEDGLSRPGLLPHFVAAEIKGFLDWFVSIANHHEVHFLWRPTLTDPKDDLVLEAAIASSADCLVTHNVSDFAEAAGLGVSVLSPAKLPMKLQHDKAR